MAPDRPVPGTEAFPAPEPDVPYIPKASISILPPYVVWITGAARECRVVHVVPRVAFVFNMRLRRVDVLHRSPDLVPILDETRVDLLRGPESHDGRENLRRLRNALGPLRTVFELALRARPNPHPNRLSIADFELVWRHQAQVEICARETPRLLRMLFLVLREGINIGPQPAHSLKGAFTRRGVTTAGWRRLCHGPYRRLETVMALAHLHSPIDAIASYLRFLCDYDIDAQPPARLLRAIARVVVDLSCDDFRFDEDMPEFWCREILRVCLCQGARVAGGDLPRFEAEEFLVVLQWARETRSGQGARLGDWPHLIRRANEWWQYELCRRLGSTPEWPSGWLPERIGNCRIVPLTCAYDLMLEARAMRHCANHMLDKCRAGTMRLFSLRDADGRRVATVALQKIDDVFRLDQARGFANVPVSAELREVVERMAHWFVE